jgi:hypothetical protein
LSDTLKRVQQLVEAGEIRISDHGYDELAADGIYARDVVTGVATAQVVADYPDYGKGPCVLVLERDSEDRPIHAVWGIPKGQRDPAVLVTAYRPDPGQWDDAFLRRR